MNSVANALPIQPGKTEAAMRLIQELSGPRRKEYEMARRSQQVSLVRAYLQNTPQGDLINLYIEGEHPETVLREIAASNDPFDIWFREQLSDIHGIDFSAPVPPAATMIFNGQLGGTGRASLTNSVPVLPGKEEELRQLCEELAGPRKKEWEASRRRLGLNKEQVYLQRTPMGSVANVYIEGDNLEKFFERIIASKDPFDRWFKERLTEIHGIDFSAPPPPIPELVFEAQMVKVTSR